MTICDKCGAELRIGSFPFCKGNPADHTPGTSAAIGDDIPGGIEIDHGICNADGTPRRFYSKSEMNKAARAAGLIPFVRHVGSKGSDKSPFTSRWI
jgi:hypothetical protein